MEDDGKVKTPAEEDKKTVEIPKEEELSEEQLKRAFEHPRFKELIEAQKKLKKVIAEREEEEKKKLEESNKFKELYEKEMQSKKELEERVKTQNINNAIITEALKLGIQDTDAVIKLADLSAVETDDNGKILNAEQVVKKLSEERPYLISKKPDIGSANPPANISGKKLYTGTEYDSLMKDHKYYMENKEELLSALIEGRVDTTR